jgi:hypothetical protein
LRDCLPLPPCQGQSTRPLCCLVLLALPTMERRIPGTGLRRCFPMPPFRALLLQSLLLQTSPARPLCAVLLCVCRPRPPACCRMALATSPSSRCTSVARTSSMSSWLRTLSSRSAAGQEDTCTKKSKQAHTCRRAGRHNQDALCCDTKQQQKRTHAHNIVCTELQQDCRPAMCCTRNQAISLLRAALLHACTCASRVLPPGLSASFSHTFMGAVAGQHEESEVLHFCIC